MTATANDRDGCPTRRPLPGRWRRPDAERHVFAFVAGSIAFFALFALILELARRTGMSVVGIGFVLFVIWLYCKRARDVPAMTLSPPAVPAKRLY